MSAILAVILIIAVAAADQLTKYLVVANMELGDSIKIIPGVFNFTYVQNTGAAFGSMSEHRWIFMILSTVAIVAIIVYIFWKKPQSKLLLSSLILITGGGVGNMIDRIFRVGHDVSGEAYHYVVDFLDFCAFPSIWMWIFNVADVCVCVGAGLLALWLILDMVREYKAEKASKAESVTVSSTPDDNGEDNGGSNNEM